MENLAANYAEQGLLNEAINHQRQAFQGFLNIFGDKSLIVARAGGTLYLILTKNSLYREAEDIQSKVVGRLVAIYGEDDSNSIRVKDILRRIQIEREMAYIIRQASLQGALQNDKA